MSYQISGWFSISFLIKKISFCQVNGMFAWSLIYCIIVILLINYYILIKLINYNILIILINYYILIIYNLLIIKVLIPVSLSWWNFFQQKMTTQYIISPRYIEKWGYKWNFFSGIFFSFIYLPKTRKSSTENSQKMLIHMR